MCVCVFVSVYVCVEREREGERERFGGFDYLRMIDLSYGTAEWIETKEKNLESKKQTERNWNAGILKNKNKQNKLKQKKKKKRIDSVKFQNSDKWKKKTWRQIPARGLESRI